jgi:hypothetical protein
MEKHEINGKKTLHLRNFLLTIVKIAIIFLFSFIFYSTWENETHAKPQPIDQVFLRDSSPYMVFLSADKGVVYPGENKTGGKVFLMNKTEYLRMSDREWSVFRNNIKFIYAPQYSYVSIHFEDGTGVRFQGRGLKRAYAGIMDDGGTIISEKTEVNPQSLEMIQNKK